VHRQDDSAGVWGSLKIREFKAVGACPASPGGDRRPYGSGPRRDAPDPKDGWRGDGWAFELLRVLLIDVIKNKRGDVLARKRF